MKQIKKFAVLQTAKVAAMLYLIGSAIFFIPYGALSFALGKIKGQLAIGLFLLAPLLYCAIGFIFVSVFCLLYNFIASKIGGIEIEIDGDNQE